jgi:hypothetical protein
MKKNDPDLKQEQVKMIGGDRVEKKVSRKDKSDYMPKRVKSVKKG